jgi:hypothetical protein
VPSPNEFWLAFHKLAEAYDREGATPLDRTGGIIDDFKRMPPTAQQQLLNEMIHLTPHLNDLYALANCAMRDRTTQDGQKPPDQRSA